MDNCIIVNATALDRSGALGILRQFIDNIPEDNFVWTVFVSDIITIDTAKNNVRLIPVPDVKAMVKRFWWDTSGLDIWLRKHGISPVACLSLQNTGFKVSKKNIPHFLYYHQSIPFFTYKWNPFDRQQRTLWFYKYIYPFFVRMNLKKDTHVFVQLDYIKQGFAEKYNHSHNYIKVFSPTVLMPDKCRSAELDNTCLNLFYPAAWHFYKNHETIVNAVNGTDRKVKLYITVQNQNYGDRIECTGAIPYSEVCSMYNSCDALLFPSYIETFGLPLIEAAMTGLPIIAADLPYAREVLDSYEGVQFVRYNDVRKWKEAIGALEKGRRYRPLDISRRPGWKELFRYIEQTINNI